MSGKKRRKKKCRDRIPILGFSGYANVGKTTLIEQLIALFKKRGLQVGVIKHDPHGKAEVDQAGTDSWKFTQAGADISLIASPKRTALIEQRIRTFPELVAMIRDVDLILAEGFKGESIVQIGVCRREVNHQFPAPLNRYIAVVSDQEIGEADIPRFHFDQIDLLGEFILQALAEGRLEREEEQP